MSFFKKNEEELKKEKELKEACKYVEIIKFEKMEDLNIELAERMKKRIIKEIQYQTVPGINGGSLYSAMILYDTWAEKAKNEKENSKEIEL